MPKLHFSTELSQHTPSERRALVECKKWLDLKSDGRLTELKSKQKEVFLAGLFLHIAAPELAHKLAANLDDADDNALLDYIARWQAKTQGDTIDISVNKPTNPMQSPAAKRARMQVKAPSEPITPINEDITGISKSTLESNLAPKTPIEPTPKTTNNEPKASDGKISDVKKAPTTEQANAENTSAKDKIATELNSATPDVKEQVASLKSVRSKGIF